MQYFPGYTSFTNESPFSDTLFVEIRKRLSLDLLSKINDVIALHCLRENEKPEPPPPPTGDDNDTPANTALPDKGDLTVTDKTTEQTLPQGDEKIIQQQSATADLPVPKNNRGRLLTDASVAQQNITYLSDLKLLNAARVKSEDLIDILYNPFLHGHTKQRTYRIVARKAFLNTAKKKQKSSKVIYKSNGKQLRFLRRNLNPVFPKCSPKTKELLFKVLAQRDLERRINEGLSPLVFAKVKLLSVVNCLFFLSCFI